VWKIDNKSCDVLIKLHKLFRDGTVQAKGETFFVHKKFTDNVTKNNPFNIVSFKYDAVSLLIQDVAICSVAVI
jgi:hypothetical protein